MHLEAPTPLTKPSSGLSTPDVFMVNPLAALEKLSDSFAAASLVSIAFSIVPAETSRTTKQKSVPSCSEKSKNWSS